jgi:hypothetical protein
VRPALTWATAVALLVAAWLVAAVTPDGEQRMADPFRVSAEIGTPAEGRNVGVTIRNLTLADRVTTGGWFAEGTWLVVELDAWAVHTELPASLGVAYLVLGDRTFAASERPGGYDTDASLYGTGLRVGFPQSGSLAFELPEDAATESGTLQLALGLTSSAIDPEPSLQGDSVIELPVDLATLPHVAERALPPTEWAAR